MTARRTFATAALTAAATAASLTAAGPAASATTASLSLIAVQKAVFHHDAKPKGPSVGDRTTFAEDLYTSGKDGKRGPKAGTDGGECAVTRVTTKKKVVTAVTTQCTATLDLTGGQLAAQGLATYETGKPGSFTLAVLGGTGEYAGARGTMTVTGAAAATTSTLLVQYTTP